MLLGSAACQTERMGELARAQVHKYMTPETPWPRRQAQDYPSACRLIWRSGQKPWAHGVAPRPVHDPPPSGRLHRPPPQAGRALRASSRRTCTPHARRGPPRGWAWQTLQRRNMSRRMSALGADGGTLAARAGPGQIGDASHSPAATNALLLQGRDSCICILAACIRV